MTEEDDQYAAAIRLGERTARAQELMANHCSYGRVALHGSSSLVGQMVGLPIGMVQVRCEHAPAPSSMAMDGLALAVEFYRRNCVGCRFRDPNGNFPTLAVESDEWAGREGRERAAAEQALAERVAGWESRRRARRAAVATQGYAARDVAAALDTLDAHPSSDPDGDREAFGVAERKLVEAGRRAPELFDEALVSVLFADASATGSGAVVAVLGELVKHGRAPAAAVASTAVEVVISLPSPDAAAVLADLIEDVDTARLVEALPHVVRLSAPTDLFVTTLPGHPAALVAAAGVVPEEVRRTVVEMVERGDAADRANAAHAAGVLLTDAPAAHLPVLGPVLVRAVSGRGIAYAGEPDPNQEACEALAQAWLRLPAETRAVVERNVDVRDRDTADSLYGILRLVRVADDVGDDGEDPALVAVAVSLAEFRAARLSGDWGVSVAVDAARDLRRTARRNVTRVAPYSRAALNALLETIAVDVAVKQPEPAGSDGAASMLAAMQSVGDGMARGNLRSALGELLGVLAREDGDPMAEVVDLLHAESGDEERDARLRAAMIDALTQAVTSSNVAVVLPELYSALLSTHTRVRAAAVELWEACARVVGVVPDALADLATVLLSDSYMAVHQSMLRRLSRLGLPEEKAAGLVNTCANWVVTYEHAGDSRVLDDALKALLWSATKADPQIEAACVAFAFEHLNGLREFDLEQMLLWRLQEHADTAAWGRAAVSLLARPSRADMFNQPNKKFAARVFRHPAGFGTVPLEDLRRAVMNYLPELPGGAVRVLALMQGAGRYEDAAVLADDAVAAIPGTDEYAPRRGYMQMIADYVHAEADAANGGVPSTANADAGGEESGEAKASPLVQHAVARRTVRAALGNRFPHRSPDAAAATLTDAAESVGTVDACSDVNLWMRMASVAALLLRADAATRRAAAPEDTATLFTAARRQAQVAAMDGEYASPVVKAWLQDVADSDSTAQVDELLLRFSRVPAPVAVHPQEPRPRPFDTAPEQATEPPLTVVTVLTIDDAPVADLLVMDSERSYRLGIDVRAEQWPAGAVACEVRLLSVWPADRVVVPSATFTETDAQHDEYGIRLSLVGDLYCNLEQTPGQPGFDLPLLVVFRYGDGTEQRAELAGHIRLRMRPFDSTQDAETGFRQLDRPLHQVLDRVNDDHSLDPDDVAAFARFFTAIVRAGPSITFDAAFRAGKKVSEGQFHDTLETKLLADPALGGRVTRRDKLSGGFDDLMHDGIVAELKFEKTTPRTIASCARYLGQPEQYGVGKGSRLSILVILDHSRKQAPAGVLENYIGWVVPAMHGYTDPRYPSMVGVVIINTHWILPSSWSRRTIDVVEHSPLPPTA